MTKFRQARRTVALTLALAASVACSEEEVGGPLSLGDSNVPPRAIVPSVIAGFEGDTITLDGSASLDSDGTIKTYAWEQVGGLAITLSGADTAIASFTAPSLSATQQLRFVLTVTDNRDATVASPVVLVTLSDSNQSPSADAGDSQIVNAGAIVTLDGSSSADADGSVAAYAWEVLSGPAVVLADETTAEASFTAPDVTRPTNIVLGLTVTDDEGKSSETSVSVLVEPVAVALVFEIAPPPGLEVDSEWPTVTVAVRNAADETIVAGAPASYTIVLSRQAGTGTLHGTLSRAASVGVATFSDLSYDVVETGVIIRASVASPALSVDAPALEITAVVRTTLFPGGFGSNDDATINAVLPYDGGVVVGGTFRTDMADSAHFALDGTDPAVGSNGSSRDAFLARYDAAGVLLWVRTFGSTNSEEIVSVVQVGTDFVAAFNVDGAMTWDAAPFDATTGTISNTDGTDDIVLARFSSTGALVGVPLEINGNGTEEASAMTTNTAGQIILVGTTDGDDVDFEPCLGDSNTALGSGGDDAFVISLSSATLWSSDCSTTPALASGHVIASNGDDFADAVAADSTGKVYVAGGFGGALDFDGGGAGAAVDPSPASSKAYLLVLTETLTFSRVHVFGSSDGGRSARAQAVGIGPADVVYVAGRFNGDNVDFGLTGGEVDTAGGYDIFMVSTDSAGVVRTGHSFVLGGTGDDQVGGISIGQGGRPVTLVGDFNDVVDFDPGAGTESFDADNDNRVFVATYGDDGAFAWAETWGGNGINTTGRAVALVADGVGSKIWVGSTTTSGTVDLDPGASVLEYVAVGSSRDAVLHAFTGEGTLAP